MQNTLKSIKALSMALAMVFTLSGFAQAQSNAPTPAPGSKPGATNPAELDLPFERPSDEPTVKDVPQPPEEEEPDPSETPPTFADEPIPSENSTIFYVIDSSCSMGWDRREYVDDKGKSRTGVRMDRAKAELRKSVSALPASFKFNMLAYGCSIKRFQGSMIKANTANKQKGIGWINGLRPSDGTMTGPATAQALQDKQNMSVVLLTDGSPNCGASGTSGHRRVIAQSNSQKAVVTVFGIGASGSLRRFCQDVASENGGAYIDIQ